MTETELDELFCKFNHDKVDRQLFFHTESNSGLVEGRSAYISDAEWHDKPRNLVVFRFYQGCFNTRMWYNTIVIDVDHVYLSRDDLQEGIAKAMLVYKLHGRRTH